MKKQLITAASTIAFLVPVLLIATIAASGQSSSNSVDTGKWLINCSFYRCFEYPGFMKNLVRELDGSARYFGGLGFGEPELNLVTEASSSNRKLFSINGEAGNAVQNPVVQIFEGPGPGVSPGPDPCSTADGEQASYATSGENPGRILIFNFRSNSMFDDGVTPNCPKSPAKTAELALSIGHEIFHGFQRLQSHKDNKSKAIGWINEATAEAAGYDYTRRRSLGATMSKGTYDSELHLDHPTSKKPDLQGYLRGYFVYEIGKKLNSRSPLEWLVELYEKKATTDRHGYNWLDSRLKTTTFEGLRDAYIWFVAERANDPKRFRKKAAETTLRVRDELAEKVQVSIKPMASTPVRAAFAASVFKNDPDEKPGKYFALLSVEVKPEADAESYALAVEDKVADKNDKRRFEVAAVLDGKEKKFFSRAILAPGRSGELKPGKADVELRAETIKVSVSECVSSGGRQPIVFEPRRPDTDIRIFAKRGKVDSRNLTYTAPASGKDELQIELLHRVVRKDGSTRFEKKRYVFAEPEVKSRGCQFKLKTPEGYVLTFDPVSKVTKTEQNPREFALFDRNFVYARDPSMGWVKMKPDLFLRMAKTTAQAAAVVPEVGDLTTILESDPGKLNDPLKWGRAPYDFLQMLEKRNLSRKIGSRVKDGGMTTCPKSAARCRVYLIDSKPAVYYDQSDRIYAVRTKRGINLVEYGSFPLKAPKNARLLSF